MLINESKLINLIDEANNILLVEPNYKRKYIPLGLAKISSYAKLKGKKVEFARDSILHGSPDLILVTSVWTYDSKDVLETLNQARFTHPKTPIVIGGIYATLNPKHIEQNIKNIIIFKGYSKILDDVIPDYSIDWQIEKPWDTFSFTFTTRGCPHKCSYCAVWRIEPELWVNPNWKKHIVDEKPNAMISDNNLSSMPKEHIKEVIGFLVQKKKRIVFDNGFDCKFISEEMAKDLARLKYTRTGMRLSFDRIEEDGIFQEAIKKLKNAGVPKSQIMAYVLYNFKDTPQEANYRMSECVKLGIRPYPQQYTKLNSLTRNGKYIGKYWTKNLLRIFRFFWLMAGFYTKMTFEEYCKKRASCSKDKMQMKNEDWEAYYK